MGKISERYIPAPSRPARVDLVLLVALTLAGWCFRESAGGLDHYDSGAYARSAAAVAEGRFPEGLHPHQHFLSPPAYFGLCGLLMKFFGVSEQVLFAVSAVFGALTIPLVWLAGRLWWGREAGFASAWLLLFSEFHVLFSRAALTDVMFAFWLLAAVVLFSLAERRASLRLALAAGAAMGIAWNTKYHGWFAGVAAAAALLPHLRPFDRARILATAGRLAAAAAVAAALYVPWFLHVQGQEGGYARLAEEHARFLAEAARFPRHAWIHAQTQSWLEGAWTLWSVMFALGWSARSLARPGSGAKPSSWMVLVPLAGLGLACAAGGSAVVAILGALGGLVALRRWRATPEPLALALLFTVTTPLYHPYARLLLPWWILAILLAGSLVQRLGEWAASPAAARRLALASGGVAILALGISAAAGSLRNPFEGGMSRLDATGLREAAFELGRLAEDRGATIAVVGEPSLVYYLERAGRKVLHLDHPRDLDARRRSGERFLLVEGIYARRTGEIKRWFESLPAPPEAIASIPVPVGPVRLLDDFSPGSLAADPRTREAHFLRVFVL